MPLRNANIIVLILSLICCTLLSAQSEQRSDSRLLVSGISVEGNHFVDAATIIAISGLRVGQELNPRSDEIPQGVKALYMRKQFSDVRIVVDKVTALGVFLKILVRENPRYSSLEVVGNDKISLKNIQDSVHRVRGELLSGADLHDIARSVKSLYAKEGLLFAVVKADTISTDTNAYVRVRLQIEEGKEYSIRSVRFEGNSTMDASALLDQIEDSKPSAWWQVWRSAKFDTAKLTQDVQHVVRYYHNSGYMNAQRKDVKYTFDNKDGAVDIVIAVDEGQRYFLRNASFEGSTVYTQEALLRRLDIAKGKPVDQDRIEKNLNGNEEQSDIRSLYLDNGYLQCQIQHNFDYVSKDSVDLKVEIRERDRFTVRRVDIAGNTKTQDRVVRRELFTQPGDFFNRGSVIRSVKGLGVLNYFNPEKLRPDVRPVSANTVDLVYQVDERSTDVLNASVGYAGTYGLTGSVGVTFNNFDISDPLRGGAGQTFSFQWDFGTSNNLRTFSLGFAEPWLFGKPTSIGFNLYDTRYYLNSSGRRTGGQFNVGRRFRFPDDYFRGDWSVVAQHYEQYGSTLADANTIFTDFSLAQTISRNSFDNLIFPSSGSRARFTSKLGYVLINPANSTYWKNELQYEFVNPLVQVDGFNRLVLYLNTELGNVTNLSTGSSFVPQLEYYSMGGNALAGINVIPLRGYTDNSLAIRDPYTDAIASRLVFKQTAELRFAVSLNPMPIYVSAFAEAGKAWRNFQSADVFSLQRSAGLGLRILLNPIGLIGFDYGYGFDPLPGSTVPSGWNFHFQFGR